LLKTRSDAIEESHPASLDGRLWITADARIDCRDELANALKAAGRECRIGSSDSALILLAYAVWGEDCVQHLRGDFAFALWEPAENTLFCARDHFGIKPFYYVEREDVLIFSNTLNCLRLHPSVSDELNEASIADFLTLGLNYDPATTTYRDIRRLPPAHFLRMSPTGIRVQRYWSPPTDGRIRYSNPADYVEHFQSIFEASVADRLCTQRSGILLSGGLDSGAVAATAHDLAQRQSLPLHAYTVTYDSILQDGEGALAKKTAEHLRIPIQFIPFDRAQAFDRWNDTHYSRPEPDESPFFAAEFDLFRKIAVDCSVVLSGEGSDNLMFFEMWPYLRQLWREQSWSKFLRDGSQYLWIRPFPWRGVRHRLKHLWRPIKPTAPPWIAPNFARRTNVKDRLRQQSKTPRGSRHPLLPAAHASLELPQWSHIFENDDPGVTRAPVEVRYPFLDLRMVNFLLALPPFPWFFEKTLLREAMASKLPETVRLRRKTPLAADPLAALLKSSGTAWTDRVAWDDQIARFIDVSRLSSPLQNLNRAGSTVHIRPYCLNFWLQSATRVRYKLVGVEARNG
jgi:asparagine synthase (glutamine-hydrolysing)